MLEAALIIPCFNETGRLDHAELARLARAPRMRLILVDDGSTDGTLDELTAIAARDPKRISVMALPRNQGKAEAVRLGMLRALEEGAGAIGFLDADLATPVEEALRLRDELEARNVDAITGARVALMGAKIERHPSRHYSGRIFATCASLVLQAPFYDTQCGAKVFRAGPALRAALAQPFVSRWAFDVELLGRLLAGQNALAPDRIAEIPLRQWTDVPGSKLRFKDMVRTGMELLRIKRDLSRRRKVSA